jgi:anti-sigma factor RsiW
MKITRDVITDLLPLYLAGEASDDTNALVEAFLAQDAEFAKLVQRQGDLKLPQLNNSLINQEDEMKALQTTQTLLRRRAIFMALGIFFSALTMAFGSFGDDEGVRWLWADAPFIALVMAAVALTSWVGYAITLRRLRTTQL